MGLVLKLTFLVALTAVGLGVFKMLKIFEVPPVPKMENTWWGPGSPKEDDTSIRPFKISVSQEVLKDLKYRLKHTKPSPPPLEGALQNYGITSNLTMKIVDFWLNQYNWKEREVFLNKFPQYKTKIQGLDIHFLHVKPKQSKGLKVIPLLVLHGWPGSVREFYEMIPLLTTPQKGRNFVYEVVVPSLPGFGFSDAAQRPGLGVAQMAVIFRNLMKRLNYDRFIVQGGDWGSPIASHMSIFFPKNVIAIHLNMCATLSPISMFKRLIYSLKPSLIVEEKYEHLVYPLSSFVAAVLEEFGYLHIQATRPDTIGTALTDSPAGLAAYILEKFIFWTNPNWKQLDDGGLTKQYRMEDLLDNVMIYWITGSITTSMRIYAESLSIDQFALNLESIPVSVATGCSRFIHDLEYTPAALLEDKYPNIIHMTDIEGGHFAAFELPDVLAKEIYDFTEKIPKLDVKKQ